MWIFKYFVCLFKDHNWIGSHDRYCLRCGKLEITPEHARMIDVVVDANSEIIVTVE